MDQKETRQSGFLVTSNFLFAYAALRLWKPNPASANPISKRVAGSGIVFGALKVAGTFGLVSRR